MTVAWWTFWISAALLAYTYFVYPLLAILLARLLPRPVLKGDATPSATVVIPALNEERVIAEKIENTLALDYPREKVEVLVVSDGSTDRTTEIARRFTGRGVTVIEFAERRGKLPALLEAVQRARGEILVFSDASGMLRVGALRAMAANFADPTVGGACGYYRSPGLERSGRAGELLYWGYEFSIKRAQSRWATLMGATGAMYALRRALFATPPPDTINDDFVIPALVVARGHRMVLEEEAVVDDLDPRMGDFRSRVRVTAGNWQQLFYCRGLLSLHAPRVCWQFLSHKVVRLASPFLLLALCASALARFPVAASAALAAALAATLPWGTESGRKLSSAARKFFAGNAAALCGTAAYFTRRGRLSWK